MASVRNVQHIWRGVNYVIMKINVCNVKELDIYLMKNKNVLVMKVKDIYLIRK